MSEEIRGERADIGIITSSRGNRLDKVTVDNVPAPLQTNVFAKPEPKRSAALGETDGATEPAPKRARGVARVRRSKADQE